MPRNIWDINEACVVVVEKTGDLKNVLIAISQVPWESTINISWIFMNL
jgi:hypothetical protein